MLPLQATGRQYFALKTEIDSAILAVMASGRWLLGQATETFEKAFAAYCGAPHAISVANGTDALEIALRALGCEGCEVVTVANAGNYTTIACRLVRATPVYVDIDPNTLLINLAEIESALSDRTRVIVLTHLFGRAVDVAAVRGCLQRLKKTNIAIVEDCAQAHGARISGRRVGSLGDLATFSFYPTKNLGAHGDAGCILCVDETLARTIRGLRQYGWTEQYRSELPFGRNSRIDEVQAAILSVKLKYLDSWNARRREIISRYEEAGRGNIYVAAGSGEDFVGHLAVCRHPERDRIREFLRLRQIATAIHYPYLDVDQPSYKNLGNVPPPLPVSRQIVAQIFTVPCFPEMTEAEVEQVSAALADV